MVKERQQSAPSGYVVLGVSVLLLVGSVVVLSNARDSGAPGVWAPFGALMLMSGVMLLPGLFTVQPNQAVVLQLFGRYIGTVKQPGLRWSNPFYTKRRLSLRVRNFETNRLKVNDHDGNPIEIAAVVVWRVIDSAEASFEVDDYHQFVSIQSESALRNLATAYSYDAHDPEAFSLRGSTEQVAARLQGEIQQRLRAAGIEAIEARISHLAYAPEIAAAMLQRQQASAIIAARAKIVEGAVGMVEMALEQLNRRRMVELDEERKAAMVSNLLVVLCGERNVQPVVNAGTLHH